MSELIITFLILTLVICVSLGGMLLVRRNISVSTLESHNDVAGFIYAVVGVIYAVLMAFVVLVVFEQFRTAEERTEKEAAMLGDMYRVSSNLREPARTHIIDLLKDYGHTMIDKEFPAMREGKFSDETKRQHNEIWKILYSYQPADETDKIWFEQVLTTFITFADAKRARMESAKQELPGFMWTVLYIGGFITIAYSYFFGTKNVWAQTLIVISLSGTVALVLLLIDALDMPFQGIIRISQEPFEQFLNYFK